MKVMLSKQMFMQVVRRFVTNRQVCFELMKRYRICINIFKQNYNTVVLKMLRFVLNKDLSKMNIQLNANVIFAFVHYCFIVLVMSNVVFLKLNSF